MYNSCYYLGHCLTLTLTEGSPSVYMTEKSFPGWVGPFRSSTGGLSIELKLIVAVAGRLGKLNWSVTTNVTTLGPSVGLYI